MARPRKNNKTAGLPDYVYFGKGRWFLRPPGGSETRLAPAGATREQIWRAYQKVPPVAPPSTRPTLRGLWLDWQKSLQFRELAHSTRTDVERALAKAFAEETSAGKFGELYADEISSGVMRLYLDKRGEKAPKRANREVAYMSMMFSWAKERDLVGDNPCLGVRRNPEVARDRYVTDEEYHVRYAIAPFDVQVAMELAYLCRMREEEIVKLQDSPDVMRPEGMLVRRVKGSKSQIINWSPRLEAAVAAGRALPRKLKTTCLLVSLGTGAPMNAEAFRGKWSRLRLKAKELGQAMDWTFHDLKAKGVSDFDGDKHQASGHKTHAMTAVYDRKLDVVRPTR